MLLGTWFFKMEMALLYSMQDKQRQYKILLSGLEKKLIQKVPRILLQPVKVQHPLCPFFY